MLFAEFLFSNASILLHQNGCVGGHLHFVKQGETLWFQRPYRSVLAFTVCLRVLWTCMLNYAEADLLYIQDSRMLELMSFWPLPFKLRQQRSERSAEIVSAACWPFVDCGLLCSPLLLVWLRNSDVILQSNPVIILWEHLLFTLNGLLYSLFYRDALNHFVGFLQEETNTTWFNAIV